MTRAFSIGEAIQYGVKRFRQEPAYCLTLIAAVEGVSLLSSLVIAYQIVLICQVLTQLDSLPPDTMVYAFLPTYLFVRTAGQLMANRALLLLHQGRKLSRDDLLGFDCGKQFPCLMRLTAAALVYFLVTTLLTFVLVIPAIFVASTFRLFKFVFLEGDLTVSEGLRQSYEISGGSKGELVTLNVLATFIRTLGILCIGVGFIPASAVCGLAEAYAYEQLKRAHAPDRQSRGLTI